MKMKCVIFLALVASAYGAAVENCHMDRLVACGNPLSEFRKEMGQSFPITEEQVTQLCENMKTAYDCAEEFQNKCMTPMQLETMGFLVEGSITAYNDFCKVGSQSRTDYLKNAECIDKSFKSDEAKSQSSYVEAALEDLNERPPEQRLTTACCGYQWLVTKSEEMGREKCGQEAVDAFNKVAEMAVSSLPNVFCSGFEPGSPKCNGVLPPPGTKPKGTIKNSHIAKSFAAVYAPDLDE